MEDLGKKIRILKLWELLKNETDENSPMSTPQIIERLKEEGLYVERKTLYSDIDLLNRFGYEVLSVRARQNLYYVADRSFDEAEIRMLVDAVFSANFITTKKSEQLAEKLSRLVSKSSYSTIMRNCTDDKDKHNNEQIWYTVDAINMALQRRKKIRFRYFDYDISRGRIYRKEGSFYEVNPVGLIFNENNYYFVAYGDKYKQVANYRIDRMDNAIISDADLFVPEHMKDFDLEKHKSESISMYVGKTARVQFLADNSLTDAMFDQFGYDLKCNKYGDDKFYFRAKVQVSPTLFRFLVSFGDKIQIVEPQKVREEYVEFLKNIIDSYN